MAGGFGLLNLDPQALQQTPPTPQGIPSGVDQGLQGAGLPTMSSVLNGMMNGATGDAQAVGGIGSRIGGMLADMGARTSDVVDKFRSGDINAGEFLKTAAQRAGQAAYAPVQFSQDFINGKVDPRSDEAIGGALGMAGMAMTGGVGGVGTGGVSLGSGPIRQLDAGSGLVVKANEYAPGKRMYQLHETAPDGTVPDKFVGNANMIQHPDGRWETGSLYVDPEARGRGLATALYQAVEQDTGHPRIPSGNLTPEGYQFWKARDPEAVQYHQDAGDGFRLSPRRLTEMMPEAPTAEDRAMVQALLDQVPAAGKTPEALAKQFVVPGAIAGGAAATAMRSNEAQASERNKPQPLIDGTFAQRGLPSMSSVLSGMMNGASGDAQAVGDMGGRLGGMLSGMVGRTGDLMEKFRSGQIGAGEFLSAAAKRGAGAAYDAAMTGPNFSQQFLSGQIDPSSEAAAGGAFNSAASVAGMSSVVPSPRGAIRSFGGVAAHDDPMAALEAALARVPQEAAPPGPRMLDPNAKSWDLYHGSQAGPDFPRFDPTKGANPAEQAVFFAPNPETAGGYAGSPRGGTDAGARVFRTTVDPGKTAVFDLGHLAETDPSFNARARQVLTQHEGAAYGPVFDDGMSDFLRNRAQHRELSAQGEAMGYPASRPDGLSFGYGHIGAAVQMAKEQGLDTAILRGIHEHGGDDQVIALTPNRVRSFYAPDQLLYSGGPGGLLSAAPLAAPSTTPRKASQ